MRRSAWTLAAGAIFAGLLAIWAVWMRPAGSQQALGTTVLEVEPADVQALVVEQRDGVTLEIHRDGDGWRIERPRQVPASSSAVESLLQALAPLEARRVIASGQADGEGGDGQVDPAAFGLAPPRAVLTLTMADGSTRRLRVGDQTPVSQGLPAYYAQDERGSAIYTIDAFVAERITGSWESFRERRLVPLEVDDVRRVRIRRDGVTLEARRDPQAPVAERRWRLTAPLEAPGDTQAIESVLRDLEFARISRFVDDEPSADSLARWGLASPRAVIEVEYVTSDDGETTATAVVMVGNEADEGGRYVKLAGSPSVYTLPQSDLRAALEADADAWVRHRVLGLARSEIQRISIGMEGRPGPYTLERDHQGWKLMPQGQTLETSEVESWLDSLWRLQAQGVAAVGRGAQPPQRSTGNQATLIELMVAGHDGVPVTRLVIPVPLQAAAGDEGGVALRKVYVEQAQDRLVYEVADDALRGIEGVIAKWMAPEQGAGSSPSASR
ncbi:MAG TPA: DUF4340 domain-containing protein [Limnochordales bacterium]